MKTLDLRGQPCPIPVVHAKKALAEEDAPGVVVLVDNITAVRNLEKMATGTGCSLTYTEDNSVYRVSITKGARESGTLAVPSAAPGVRGPVVLITADQMGSGAEELGRLLIKGFIFSLTQLNPLPEAVIFLNSGAHLTTKGANTIPDLKTLEEKGAGIYTCGTCANYYKLTESLGVGSIVDMMNITNQLAKSSCLITI